MSDTTRFERKFVIRSLSVAVDKLIRANPFRFKRTYPPRWVNNVYLDSPLFRNFRESTSGNTERRKERIGLGEEYALTPPDIMFSDELFLDCGDVNLEMYYLGVSHTDAHIMIYVPEESLLFVGDTFDYNYLPWINKEGDQDVDRWITVLDTIFGNENGVETVIGGHREVFSGELMAAFHRYLKESLSVLLGCQ